MSGADRATVVPPTGPVPRVREARRVAPGGLRRDVALVFWQIRYEQRAFWRNRQRGFFTFAFPLMFLVVFGAIYNGQHIPLTHGRKISYDTFFVPGILAYGVISASYLNLATQTAYLRDLGILKRMQGTPLPAWVYIAARIGSSALNVVLMSVVTFVFGKVFYSVSFPARAFPPVLVTLVIATAAFTTLGIGITRVIKNADAAPVVVNLTVLPLTFISGIWFHGNIPKTLQDIAAFFPLRPLAGALQHALNPFTTGSGFVWHDLRTLAIWAAVGALLMWRAQKVPEGDVKRRS